MDKTAIKNFAIWARNKLMTDISYRAGLMGITENGIASALPQSTGTTEFYDIGTVEPYSISGEAIKQRKKLVEIINRKAEETDYATAYKYIIEEVAYTWFNRLIAVRFMEVNDYLPSHIRVLSSESNSKMEPDLVTTPFDAELEFTSEEKSKIIQLKNDNELDELFRLLFIKQCNALNEILPALFEKTSDYTELLLNISAIDREGVVYHLIYDIPEENFDVERGGQVEIIGWLYQYYNTEPKNEAFAKKGKITKEEIPAVTQLFTPDWIVRYMVENSLGRLWIERNLAQNNHDIGPWEDNNRLKSEWKYYLEEAEQEEEVKVQLEEIRKEYRDLRPEDIKIIDPCMGSGHILVYAFDVLMQIYELEGYGQREAAKSILENNLYGLDIDDRAYQMAYFAVMMKARQYNRRILNGETSCHVYSIQESNGINQEHLKYFGKSFSEENKTEALRQISSLVKEFCDAKEYGSIISVENYNWELLKQFLADVELEGQVSFDTYGIDDTKKQLNQLLEIGKVMAQQYDVVVTNPPYMGLNNGNGKLNKYVKDNYPDSKSDLFAVFIERCEQMAKKNCFHAMITQHSWMFLSSFEKLRTKIQCTDIVNMAHLGARAFDEIGGEVVQTTSFVIRKSKISNYQGIYCRLIKPTTQKGKEEMYLTGENRYKASQNNFSKIPGAPIAYWASDGIISAFMIGTQLENIADCCTGMQTGDNDKYVRYWYEVNIVHFDYASNHGNTKWIKYNCGGESRKWYGNHWKVVNWEDNGKNLKKERGSVIRNEKHFFEEGISWKRIGSSDFFLRYLPEGFIFDQAGDSMFVFEKKNLFYVLGFVNTKVALTIFKFIAPTLNLTSGNMKMLPIIWNENRNTFVLNIVYENIEISCNDWDSFETSWDFQKHPLIQFSNFTVQEIKKDRTRQIRDMGKIEDAFHNWNDDCNSRFNTLKANEEELNRIFIEIYGLQEELTPEVEDKDVTVCKADLQRDIKSLLSYAVGCMFGRYSLDVEGLVYAGGEWDDSKYSCFIPDNDNIIPITDEEYLEDDIVARLCEWLKVAYGEETLEENLDFIANALGNKGNTSREIIRNYFLKDFFKDHCKIYQKRPIYWLYDSGKQNGFKALIYLHRYNADTIGNLRVDYLHRMQRVYESEISRMQDMIDNSGNAREVGGATKRKEKLLKQLKECQEYDEKIGHLALSRIELDLDDGVKVNYEKVQTGSDGKKYQVLAKI